jgi:hypothetical protein
MFVCFKLTSLLNVWVLFIVHWVRVMMFNATFNNISVISWRSVLLVEETRVPGENHRPAASHCQTLSHNVVSNTPHHERDSHSQL